MPAGFRQQARRVGRAFTIVWSAARWWTLCWAAALVVQGIVPGITVYLTKLLVDGLVAAIQAGGTMASLQPAIKAAIGMAGVLLASATLQSAIGWIRVAQAERTADAIRYRIHGVASSVDLAYYETPAYYDRLNQVLSDAATRPLALLESFGGLIRNGITLLAMAVLILPYGWWLPVVLLVGTLPAFLVLLRYNRQRHRWFEFATPRRRWVNYFDTVLTHSAMASEVRLFDLGSRFMEDFQGLRGDLRNERIAIERHHVFGRLAAAGLGLAVLGGAMAWMALRVARGAGTLGDLALFYQAFNQGQNLLRSVLASVGQIYGSMLFLENLFDFLDLQPVIEATSDRPCKDDLEEAAGSTEGARLSFRGVSFRYPEGHSEALRGVDVDFEAGSVTAIVGENGSGKSTLLKLGCRLYDPTSGAVLLNGSDLRDLPVVSLRRAYSVLFQFPVNYHASVKDSITLGELHTTADEGRMMAAARASGFDKVAERLPKGYDTLLGKWFVEGQELSGGEWQRLAMARALYRRSRILILDEPTSMMDAASEADWFDRLLEHAAQKTVVIITHRLTIARRASRILVMREGEIVEEGAHDALCGSGGWYADAWRRQIGINLTAAD